MQYHSGGSNTENSVPICTNYFESGAMKMLFLEKRIFFVRRLMSLGVLFGLLFTISCSDSSSSPSVKTFTIKYPSVDERYFGEKSDFYVIGLFSDGVQTPGNIRIALFKGETASGTALRTLESHVDELTGVTPKSAIEQDYPHGVAHNLDKAPDLVNDPGGFYYPGNKVLVTEDYFGGIILGGSTKDFDTDYTDAAGNPLEDLTEGVYTLKVTGLSGDISSYTETIHVYFKPIRKLFGAFKPENHKEKFFAYAKAHGYRKLWDPLPGYFSPISWDNCYMIEKRARPQNSLEVVNTIEGATYGTSENALIGFILYNLKDMGATTCLEIGKALLTEVIDSPNTFLSNTDNASIALRKELLSNCNLYTVLDLPGGTFTGAGVKTVVLFFGKGSATKKTWFYQLNL